MSEMKTNGGRRGKCYQHLKCSTDSLSPKTLSLFNKLIKNLVPHYANNLSAEIQTGKHVSITVWKYSGQIDAVRIKYLNMSLMDSSFFVTLLSLLIPIPPGTSSFTPKCPVV